MKKFGAGEGHEALAQITGIMPEVDSIIEKYDQQTGVIHKDITQ
jgi:hypothetical protein